MLGNNAATKDGKHPDGYKRAGHEQDTEESFHETGFLWQNIGYHNIHILCHCEEGVARGRVPR